MFTTSRQNVLDALEIMGIACCAYSFDTWSDRCDCKYGIETGKWPYAGEQGNGCPELRTLHLVISTMTDDEWTLISHRGGGFDIHSSLFGADGLADRLRAANTSVNAAAKHLDKARAVLADES